MPDSGTLAARANPYDLFERSLEDSEAEVRFFDTTYRALRRGKKPLVLREDFGGNAKLTKTWCVSDPQRRGLAVDLDAEMIALGRARNVDGLDGRLDLVERSVLDVVFPKSDVTCAMNFSFCALKTRAQLRAYLEVAHAGLEPDGIFICELFGGTEAIVELQEQHEVEDFRFVWEQERFNPITRELRSHIHFAFEDGSILRRAFTYDWRVWTIPDVDELLREVGFRTVRVFWERTDQEDEFGVLQGSGEYVETREVDNQESWHVYIVGEK